jgi:hypothetical protein
VSGLCNLLATTDYYHRVSQDVTCCTLYSTVYIHVYFTSLPFFHGFSFSLIFTFLSLLWVYLSWEKQYYFCTLHLGRVQHILFLHPRQITPGWGAIKAESIERFIEGQAFLRSSDLAPRPPPPPPAWPATHRKTEKDRHIADERGGGEGVDAEPNHRPRESLALCKSFSTLCTKGFLPSCKREVW